MISVYTPTHIPLLTFYNCVFNIMVMGFLSSCTCIELHFFILSILLLFFSSFLSYFPAYYLYQLSLFYLMTSCPSPVNQLILEWPSLIVHNHKLLDQIVRSSWVLSIPPVCHTVVCSVDFSGYLQFFEVLLPCSCQTSAHGSHMSFGFYLVGKCHLLNGDSVTTSQKRSQLRHLYTVCCNGCQLNGRFFPLLSMNQLAI